ncbi:MAG: hypothetical protein JXB03_03420 [Spirochaetales bacterium]|nr:hypothetical protein [Spirochaetales bacterium]
MKDIVKKDSPLHYRNEYTANLYYEGIGNSEFVRDIGFTVERDPLGKPKVSVHLHGILEYPLIPAKRKITEYIMDLEKQGKLV